MVGSCVFFPHIRRVITAPAQALCHGPRVLLLLRRSQGLRFMLNAVLVVCMVRVCVASCTWETIHLWRRLYLGDYTVASAIPDTLYSLVTSAVLGTLYTLVASAVDGTLLTCDVRCTFNTVHTCAVGCTWDSTHLWRQLYLEHCTHLWR